MWKLVRALVLAVVSVAVLSPVAGAQQWSIYLTGGAGSLRVQDTGHVYGGTFGLSHMKQGTPAVAWGTDFRLTMMNRGDVKGDYTDERLDTGLIGLRVAATPRMRLKPYGEALLGFGYWRGGLGLTRQDKYTSVLQGLAGLDYRIAPKIDWRVAEITYSRMSGQIHFINPITVSTGIVFRIP